MTRTIGYMEEVKRLDAAGAADNVRDGWADFDAARAITPEAARAAFSADMRAAWDAFVAASRPLDPCRDKLRIQALADDRTAAIGEAGARYRAVLAAHKAAQ